MAENGCQSAANRTAVNTSLTVTHQPQRPGHIKTPFQILHEYAIKSGNLPVYTMEVAEGEAHQPSFIFNVNIADVCCSGHGSSKKAAKHRAAEGALSLLQINMGAAAAAGCPAVKAESNGVAAEPSDHPNSVGILQELAMQRCWRLPEYAVQMESGPAHRREFTVTCRMESLSETSMGNSKKGGKKAAAEKMIAKLQSLSGCGEITWTPKPSIRLEDLRASTAEKLSLLRRSPLSIPNTDYTQMLSELAAEQSFEGTYFNIDELTVNGQYQCLVELSTSPATVCHGTGISCGNAQNDAAHSALQYVKIMASIN